MGTSVVCQKYQAAQGITILDAMRDPLLFGPWFKDGTLSHFTWYKKTGADHTARSCGTILRR